jgi:hypothetical protein
LKAKKEKLTQEITEIERQLEYLKSDFFRIFGSLIISIFEEEKFYLNSSIFEIVEEMAMEASKLIDIVDLVFDVSFSEWRSLLGDLKTSQVAIKFDKVET